MIAAPLQPPRSTLISSFFEDQWNEVREAVLPVTGRLPEDLRGTLYRNTPTGFRWPNGTYGHWFDGHGQVHAFTLEERGVRYSNRFVRTPALERDRSSGTPQGGFGGPIPGGLFTLLRHGFPSRGSTQVMRMGERVLALQEGAWPYALDLDLETVGKDDLGFLARGEGLTAHPHWDPRQRRFLTASMHYGPQLRTPLDVNTLDGAGRLLSQTRITLPYKPTLVHDFGFTEKRIAVPVFPLLLDVMGFITARSSLGFDSHWRPEKGCWLFLVDRATGRVRRVELPTVFAYHTPNCFEDGEDLVMDLITYAHGEVIAQTGRIPETGFAALPDLPLLRRYRVRPDGRVQSESLTTSHFEFPQVHPARAGVRARYYYYAGSTTQRPRTESELNWCVARLDTETGDTACWKAPPGHYVGEVVVVERPGLADERDVWLLTVIYDPEQHRSRLAVLDGRSLEAGPVAEALAPHHIPAGFHGSFHAS